MKLGCCGYSYRDKLTTGEMTYEQFLDACVALEFEGVELTAYYFQDTEPSTLVGMKRACFLRGLEVSGTAIGTDFCQPDAERREADIAQAREWLGHSETLGAPVMRVFAGGVREGDTEDAARARCIAAIESLLPLAERHGVVVALENHGGITASAEQVDRVVRAIGPHPWFGINLDTGNYRDPRTEFPQTAPHVVTVHAKLSYHTGIEKRLVDWPLVRRVLEDGGYRGFINMEYEESEDPAVGVPRFMEALISAFR